MCIVSVERSDYAIRATLTRSGGRRRTNYARVGRINHLLKAMIEAVALAVHIVEHSIIGNEPVDRNGRIVVKSNEESVSSIDSGLEREKEKKKENTENQTDCH